MQKWWKVAAVGLVHAALSVVIAWMASGDGAQPLSNAAEVRSVIETGLPSRSNVQQTLAYIDEQGWERTEPEPNDPADDSGGAEQRDPRGSTVFAAITRDYPGPGTTRYTYMVFDFDANGVLTGYLVEDSNEYI